MNPSQTMYVIVKDRVEDIVVVNGPSPKTRITYGHNIQGNGLDYFITYLTTRLNFMLFFFKGEKRRRLLVLATVPLTVECVKSLVKRYLYHSLYRSSNNYSYKSCYGYMNIYDHTYLSCSLKSSKEHDVLRGSLTTISIPTFCLSNLARKRAKTKFQL